MLRSGRSTCEAKGKRKKKIISRRAVVIKKKKKNNYYCVRANRSTATWGNNDDVAWKRRLASSPLYWVCGIGLNLCVSFEVVCCIIMSSWMAGEVRVIDTEKNSVDRETINLY